MCANVIAKLSLVVYLLLEAYEKHLRKPLLSLVTRHFCPYIVDNTLCNASDYCVVCTISSHCSTHPCTKLAALPAIWFTRLASTKGSMCVYAVSIRIDSNEIQK